MERLLSDEIRKQIAEVLKDIETDVELILVTADGEAAGTDATGPSDPGDPLDIAGDLLEEVSAISPHLNVVRMSGPEAAMSGFSDDFTPTVYIRRVGDVAPRFHFLGAPTGYEFGSFIEDIRDVASGTTSLSDETKEFLATLASAPAVRLEVFSTPTCPYCPRAVRLAHQMAMASENVVAVAVDAAAFPDLSRENSVYAVPKTVINGSHSFEGMVPERVLVQHIREAVGA